VRGCNGCASALNGKPASFTSSVISGASFIGDFFDVSIITVLGAFRLKFGDSTGLPRLCSSPWVLPLDRMKNQVGDFHG
jgi:hypothetical protein